MSDLVRLLFLNKQNPWYPSLCYLHLDYLANIWGSPKEDDVRLRDQQIPPGTEMVATPEPHSWQFETFCILSASTHRTFRNGKIQTRRALLCNQETSGAQRRAWHVPFCFHTRHQWERVGLIRRNQTDRSSHKLPSETVATVQKN